MTELEKVPESQKTTPYIKGGDVENILANNLGMTIVEIMIVITIIASLMGAVGFMAFGAVDKANNSEAQIRANKLTESVQMYYQTSSPRGLPSSLGDLAKGVNKIIDKVEPDPWGNEYIYTKRGNRDFEIRSAGADGVPNTEDDICSEGPCSESE